MNILSHPRLFIRVCLFIVASGLLSSMIAVAGETLSGSFDRPDIFLSWRLSKEEGRLFLTGQAINKSFVKAENMQLAIRVTDENAVEQGRANFLFFPTEVHHDDKLPYGMIIKVPDSNAITSLDFNLYYEQEDSDGILFPILQHFSAKLPISRSDSDR